jgi:thiamine-monophosphate kinase
MQNSEGEKYYNSQMNRTGRKRRANSLDEETIIDLFRAPPRDGTAVAVGIGDDTAVVNLPSGKNLLLTTDVMTEGVHFTRQATSPEALGYKLAAVNVSDIAAMGGTPLFALLSLSLPPDLDKPFLRRFRAGLSKGAKKYGFEIVGGDTTSSAAGIFVSLSLLGRLAGRHPLTRTGARPGDILCVTGHLGASSLGLSALLERAGSARAGLGGVIRRHLRPDPPLNWGKTLGRRNLATAAMDLSDGLSTDLNRLCRESGVGAEVYCDDLPVRPFTRRAAALLGRPVLESALHGGEEYELLFTARPAMMEKVEAAARAQEVEVTPIGRIRKPRLVERISSRGERSPFPPGGWRHFRGGDSPPAPGNIPGQGHSPSKGRL